MPRQLHLGQADFVDIVNQRKASEALGHYLQKLNEMSDLTLIEDAPRSWQDWGGNFEPLPQCQLIE
jgi:hypothetical protein